MLNLRQLKNTNSNEDSFSRAESRVTSGFLGNISEPLDHAQLERLHDDDPRDEGAEAEGSPGGGVDVGSVSGLSRTLRDEDERVRLEAAVFVVDHSGTRWNISSERISLAGAKPNARPSGTRCDEVVHASCAFD